MRIKSLLVTLGILGSSSLALADHGFETRRQQARYRDQITYRQPVYREPAYRPSTTWQALTSQERLERGRDVFDVRSRARFAQLRLQNQTGRMLVRQIEIVFANGERQYVQVGRVLNGNHDMVNIDLAGEARRIDRIIVDGRSARDGSYQLYAM